MRRLFSIIALFVLLPALASATTYYVSSSSGSDANRGTSSTAAWQTIAHVNAQTFEPGDSILFKRGDVWNESLVPPSSGTSASSIAFDAYGTGAPPNLTGYYPVPSSSWISIGSNAWKAPLPSTYSTVNFCLFGSIWGQKVSAVSTNLTAQWDFYFANGNVYVYSQGNPASYYNEPIVPMALSNVPVINVNNQTWLTFQHFLVNWFDDEGVYVQGTSDHLVFANMEADSLIPQGTQPLGFYVNETSPGPGDIKIYNSEAHLNYDGFRFDGAATSITMINDKGYANRDGALVDNTGVVTYSYCHFYASSLAVAGSTDVEWTSGPGPNAGAGNIPQDTAPAVEVYQRYPAMVTLTVDDAGMTPGADSYYADQVVPVAQTAGIPVGAAITVGYPLAQTLIPEFQSWIDDGLDVAAHSISHTYYTNTDAIDLQYIGSGSAATLSISGNTFTISVSGAPDSVTYNLAQGQPQGTMLALAQALAATGKYTYSFLTPCQGPYGTGCSAYTAAALLSQDLANVSGQDVKTSVYHAQLNVTRLTTDEITLSRQWMTTNLTGLPSTPVYVYPGGYETATMQGITAGIPYSGARGALKEDLGVKDTYADGFNAQNITSFGVNPTWMGITPALLNQKIDALVWKESVWGVPWGIFWHLNELTQDDPIGGTEITDLINDFKNSGATVKTNTSLVSWLLTGTQENGADGTDYYKIPATSMTLDFRPTEHSPVVDAGENLGTAYELDINGVNQNTYGSGWEIGAHVYLGYATYGEDSGSGEFAVGTEIEPNYSFAQTDTAIVQPVTPAPNMGGLVGANTCQAPSDFGLLICRITDSTLDPNSPNQSLLTSSTGEWDQTLWNINSTLLTVQGEGGRIYPLSFNPLTLSAARLYTNASSACPGPAYNCLLSASTVVQTPNTPPFSGDTGYNAIGFDATLNPLGTAPITRLTDSTMLNGQSPSPTPSQGDNDKAGNCAGRGVTPGSTFTSASCANASLYIIVGTYGGAPYFEGLQKTANGFQVVAPFPAATTSYPEGGNFAFAQTDPWTLYSSPASTSGVAPAIYKTVLAWDGVAGHTLTWTYSLLYNLQSVCPLPSSFEATWASSVSTDATDTYFSLALSNTGGQNTGVWKVTLNMNTSPVSCEVYETDNGNVTHSGSWGSTGTVTQCEFYIHDSFDYQNSQYISMSTGGMVSGHACAANTLIYQPNQANANNNLLVCSAPSTTGGTVCGGGHDSFGASDITLLSNPQVYHFNAGTIAGSTPIAPFFTYAGTNCENHIANQNADALDQNPVISASANPNYSLSGTGSSWTFPGENEVDVLYPTAVGGRTVGTMLRVTHTFALGESTGCGSGNVGPFGSYLYSQNAIGHVFQDGSGFVFSSDMLGQLGTDTSGGVRADLFVVAFQNSTGFSIANGTAAWSYNNPTLLYDLPTGGTTLDSYNLSGYNTGAAPPQATAVYNFSASASCLGPTYSATWSAFGGLSKFPADQTFVAAFSDAGAQDTGSDVVAYVSGSGCSHLDTLTGVVTGDWGAAGTVGISDRFHVHDVRVSRDGEWAIITYTSCTTGCSALLNVYFWQIGTTNLYPSCSSGSTCSGHWTEGVSHFINNYNSPFWQQARRPYGNNSAPTNVLSGLPLSGCTITESDQHQNWANVDALDTYPFFTTTAATGSGAQTPDSYNCGWVNEVLGISPLTGTVYRFAHTYATGLNWNTAGEYALGSVSQDGNFFAFTSDWMGTLGTEGGANGTCTNSPNSSTACRNDVFVVALTGSAAPATLFGFTETNTASSNFPTVNYAMQRFWDSPPLQWPSINTASGVFNFSNLDGNLAQAYSNGVTAALYTLARTPTWASSNPGDTTCAYTGAGSGGGDGECDAPNDLNADGSGTDATWKAWITAIASHVNASGYCTGTGASHACIKYWEIWNEPDTETNSSGRFWAGTFAQLARLTEDANCIITGRGVIHENGNGTATPCTATAIDPTAKIVMSSGHADQPALTFAQNQLYCNNTTGVPSEELPCPNPANAIANAIDIVNFHMKPGNETGNTCPAPTPCTPESAMQMYLASIHGILQSNELAKPLWDGEAAYSTAGFTGAYADADMAASFMPRFYLINWSLGISAMAWYTWDALSAEPAEVQTSYQQAYSWLAGATLYSPCSASGTVWSCGIVKSGVPYLIMWDTSQSCSGGSCTTGNQTVSSRWTEYQDMTTASTPASIAGHVVPVGIKPVVLH